MTALPWILLAVAAVLAVADWIAVGLRWKPLEYVCKPATMLVLIGVALTLEAVSDTQRVWFVAALALSAAGDVFLMLPRDRFVAGLTAFLLAHLAYVGGLVVRIADPWLVAGGLVLVLAAGTPIALRIVRGARAADPRLGAPVAAYIAVISGMVACALASGIVLAAVGALLFFASDALIGWNRFVRHLRWAPVVIMVTYHLGQAGLVASLAT